MAAATGLTTPSPTWLASRWERLNGPQRLAGVDLARGLAVLGMLAAHLLVIEGAFDWADAATWLDVVNGRSSILFATLAGVSIGLVTGGRTPPRGGGLITVWLRLIVRACALWIVGVVLIATGVPVYVILPAYAILFLLATAFVALDARGLFVAAGAFAVAMPLVQPFLDALPLWSGALGRDLFLAVGWNYPFTVWIAFLLAGMGLARAGIRSLAVQLRALAVGVALAIVGYGLDSLSGPPRGTDWWSEVWTAGAHSSGILEVIGSGGFAIAAIAACLLVCRTAVTWVVLPLRAVGSMPLTAYAGQILVWAVVAAQELGRTSDLDGFRALDPFWPFVGATLVLCTAWTLLVGRGPLEWAVDAAARLATRTRPAS